MNVVEKKEAKVPTGIKLLAVLQIIGGLFLIGFPCFVALYHRVINIGIVLMVGLGVGTIFLAKALPTLKTWAWYLNISLYGLAVLLSIAALFLEDPALFLWDPSFALACGVARAWIPLVVAVYLFSVRKHFGVGVAGAREEK